jgi:NAD(P)-dependent dehydrogenase (short-subunit alcohol dehydrogenase family)
LSILDRFRPDGRVAIVTGASSVTRRGLSTALAEAGADLVLAVRRADRLAEMQCLVEAAGRRRLIVPADVAPPEDSDRVATEAMAQFGQVDVGVNNAGLGAAVPAT